MIVSVLFIFCVGFSVCCTGFATAFLVVYIPQSFLFYISFQKEQYFHSVVVIEFLVMTNLILVFVFLSNTIFAFLLLYLIFFTESCTRIVVFVAVEKGNNNTDFLYHLHA